MPTPLNLSTEQRLAIGKALYLKEHSAAELSAKHKISTSAVWDCRKRYMDAEGIPADPQRSKPRTRKAVTKAPAMEAVHVDMVPREMYDELLAKYEKLAGDCVSLENIVLLAGKNLK